MYEFEEVKELAKDLRKVVKGRRIVKVEDEEIVLDNGARLGFRGYGDCCAYGEVDWVRYLAYTDNAVTKVEPVDDDGGFRISIYAAGVPTVDLGVSMSEGSGCYGFGVELIVKEAGI